MKFKGVIIRFFYDWYVAFSLGFLKQFLSFANTIEGILAVREMARRIFQPLYQDYDVAGYILGFFFRIFRIIIGVIIHLIVFLFFLILYFIWVLLPPFVVYMVFVNLFSL